MEKTAVILLVLGAWVGTGVVLALIMGRRGHAPFSWGALGVVFGPLCIPLALSSTRREQEARAQQVGAGIDGSGPLDVVVGVDGSAEATAALRTVVRMLGPQLGRLTIASVLDFDTAESDMQWGERDRTLAELERDADLVAAAAGRRPETLLLAGQPAEALGRFAADEGFALLAVGSRGRGLSKLLLGSVAAQLARGSTVPVLILPDPTAGGHRSEAAGATAN